MATDNPPSDNNTDGNESKLSLELLDGGRPFGYGTIQVEGFASARSPYVGIDHHDEPTNVEILSQLGKIELGVKTEDEDGVCVGASAHLDPDQAEEVAYNLLAAAEDLRKAKEEKENDDV